VGALYLRQTALRAALRGSRSALALAQTDRGCGTTENGQQIRRDEAAEGRTGSP